MVVPDFFTEKNQQATKNHAKFPSKQEILVLFEQVWDEDLKFQFLWSAVKQKLSQLPVQSTQIVSFI